MHIVAYLVLVAGILGVAASVVGAETLGDKPQDKVVLVPRGDPDMEAAFRMAQSTLKGFLDLARSPRPTITSMAVKVAIHDRDENEYFWISPFVEKNGLIAGKISNEPSYVHNVRQGQTITFKTADVVDWLYRENGHMYGNFTACVILKSATRKERRAFMRENGFKCDDL